jgi:molybdopterin-containing oxidoreductase family membrane subunit
MTYWPNFRSPLVWDVFAVSTYLTISLVFWFIGLIPDLASLRDQTTNKFVRVVYGLLSMGWRNSVRHWNRYETAYLLLAGLATPLVLSVHTVVSFDFAVGIVPGWHTTIFPPYFVAGAIYSGFAMVLVLAIPIRMFYGIEDLITMRHLENSAMVMLATGWIVCYGYAFEAFMNWFGGDPYEATLRWNRLHGPYAAWYYALLFSNLVVPQLLWWKKIRTRPLWLFFISLDILVGMWLERFIIVVVSLTRDFVNSSWGQYYPTQWDFAIFVGTLGFFAACMFLFLRLLPAVSISELKTLIPQAEVSVKHEAEVHQ